MLQIYDRLHHVSQYSATLVSILFILPPPSQFSFYTCTRNTHHWMHVDGIEGINVLMTYLLPLLPVQMKYPAVSEYLTTISSPHDQ